MQTSLSRVTTHNEVVGIAMVSPGVALVSCNKTITDENADDSRLSGLPPAARLTYLMTENDGEWRIALAQTTPVL